MKKYIVYTLLLILTLSLAGCSKKDHQEVLKFQNELNVVLTNIEHVHNKLNAIDVTSEDATDTILDNLEKLKESFASLAEIQVTDKDHSYITALASEGSEYMNQAYDLFVTAYGSDTFDEEAADLAYKYLERASKRVRVIVSMLHGEVPDDVIVH